MSQLPPASWSVAIAIPCLNEGQTVGEVVRGFRSALPDAQVFVFDNGSEDDTVQRAVEAGAIVRHVRSRGKGHVVRAILDSVSADATIIVDGDGTYVAEEAHRLLQPVRDGQADMVVGDRLQRASSESLRLLHRVGNRVIVALINLMFSTQYRDILSGYRVLSRRFLETVPVLTSGFEIETELTVRALEEGMTVVEMPIQYKPRPVGSASKLRSFQDGYRILLTAAVLLRDHYPLRVFGLLGVLLITLAVSCGVLRVLARELGPEAQAVLGYILVIALPLGVVCIGIGLTVNAVNTRFREMAQIARRLDRRD